MDPSLAQDQLYHGVPPRRSPIVTGVFIADWLTHPLSPSLLQRKCDMYWPKDVGPEARVTYGFFEVQLEREEVLANYTVRTMKLKHLKVREKAVLCRLYSMIR